MSVISLLQLATRTGIPHQSEIQSDYQVVSFSLHSLLILVTRILSTNGTSEHPISPFKIRNNRPVRLRKRRFCSRNCDVKSTCRNRISLPRARVRNAHSL